MPGRRAGGSSGEKKSPRDVFLDAVTSTTGREAVALLFAGIAAYEPVRQLIEPDDSPTPDSPPVDAGSGNDPGGWPWADVDPNVEPMLEPIADFYYEEWTITPTTSSMGWADGSVDGAFPDPFTGSSSWYEDVEIGGRFDDDPVSGFDGSSDADSSTDDVFGGESYGGEWL